MSWFATELVFWDSKQQTITPLTLGTEQEGALIGIDWTQAYFIMFEGNLFRFIGSFLLLAKGNNFLRSNETSSAELKWSGWNLLKYSVIHPQRLFLCFCTPLKQSKPVMVRTPHSDFGQTVFTQSPHTLRNIKIKIHNLGSIVSCTYAHKIRPILGCCPFLGVFPFSACIGKGHCSKWERRRETPHCGGHKFTAALIGGK